MARQYKAGTEGTIVLGADSTNTTLGGVILNLGGAETTTMNLGTASVPATFGGMPLVPSATVAATGSAQGNAAALATGFTLVTAGNGTKGVKLPTAAAGKVCFVINGDNANAALKVYPNTSDAINLIAANTEISMATNTAAMFVAYDDTTWYTIPRVPS